MNIKNFDFYYEVRRLSFVDEIWVFGSRARGHHHTQSDIDLAIVCPRATDDEGVWHEMLNDRNMTSHTYKRDVVKQIYYKIDTYYKHMQKAFDSIHKLYKL